jgi:hypothetical protein
MTGDNDFVGGKVKTAITLIVSRKPEKDTQG